MQLHAADLPATDVPSEAPGAGHSQAPTDVRFAVLRRRNIYILPTRQGVAFGAVLLLMLLGSVNYNNGLGYALSFLLASLVLVSLIHTYRNLAGLGLRLTAGPAVFAGGVASFELIVDNRGQPQRPAILLRLRPQEPRPGGLDTALLTSRERRRAVKNWRDTRHRSDTLLEVDIPPDSLQRIPLPVAAKVRGWLAAERFVIASRYPFGIFRAWSTPKAAARCLVYAKPAPPRPLPPAQGGSVSNEGRHGRGREDFSGLREYRHGDSPRRIHWKALAREQGLLVKQFEGGMPAQLRLRWRDTVGPTEVRVAILTRWALDADSAGHQFSLELEDEHINAKPSGGSAHLGAVLAALATFRLPSSSSLTASKQGLWSGGV